MSRTLSPEMDAWLAQQLTAAAEIKRAVGLRYDTAQVEPNSTAPAWTHDVEFTDVEFTDAEWRLLWKRFQPVSTPMIGFARRIQIAASDVMSLSKNQRRWVLALAFKYRRKVFFNPRAGELNEAQFVAGIRELAAKKRK